MLIDHNAMLGPYPFRALPDPTAAQLIRELDRCGIDQAWTGWVPSIYYRDAAAGNDELLRALDGHANRLRPVPAVNPAWPAWEREVARAVEQGAPAVRTWPSHYGFGCTGSAMRELTAACAEHGLTVHLTVRLEDSRQRSRLDVAADLIGADVRNTLRAHAGVKVLVSNADRAFIEEVHWGSTPDETARLRWDHAWLWGQPEDHVQHISAAVGREALVFGSAFPFRLFDNAFLKHALLD